VNLVRRIDLTDQKEHEFVVLELLSPSLKRAIQILVKASNLRDRLDLRKLDSGDELRPLVSVIDVENSSLFGCPVIAGAN
jgi:hypothetical protein